MGVFAMEQVRAAEQTAHSAHSGQAREVLDGAVTEKQFLQQIIDLARYSGWLAYHVHDSRRSEPGFPDLVLARGLHLMFWEVKREVGRLSPEQTRWLNRLGGTHFTRAEVVRPSDWERIAARLTASNERNG
jgi:hypothetical protein